LACPDSTNLAWLINLACPRSRLRGEWDYTTVQRLHQRLSRSHGTDGWKVASENNKLIIVQCATFFRSLNPRNIDKSISDIRIRIRFLFESSFWTSVSGCKLTILPDSDHLWWGPRCKSLTMAVKTRSQQRWADCHILRSRSTSNYLKLCPSPTTKDFSKVKSKSKWSPKNLKNAAFSQLKLSVYFQLTQSQSGPDPKFWRDLWSGSNPNSTKFAIVRIQSNPSPVQCSSLIHRSKTRQVKRTQMVVTVRFTIRVFLTFSD